MSKKPFNFLYVLTLLWSNPSGPGFSAFICWSQKLANLALIWRPTILDFSPELNLSPLFLFSMQAMQRNATSVLPSQQRLNKLCFLQKLGCQKTCWDQARLSSLVNKQIALSYGSGVSPPFQYFVLCWASSPCPVLPYRPSQPGPPGCSWVSRPGTAGRTCRTEGQGHREAVVLRPTNTFLGPSNTFLRPSNTFPRPCNTFPRPNNTALRPPDTYLRPSNTVLRPSYNLPGS